jgi:hypothetical protein
VGFLDRLRAGFRAARPWDGLSGRPPSGNGASSLHLVWQAPPGDWVTAEATLEILEPPAVDKLYFWAMQVSFHDRGRQGGAGHIGLQWHGAHPGGTAVNWGGYGPDGVELRGSPSPLPSATGNVNTRDYAWLPNRAYRLRVSWAPEPGPRGRSSWRGEIDDLTTGHTTHVRDLWAVGATLGDPLVWSEVFADCDDPSTIVRWSDLRLIDRSGAVAGVDAVSVNYQSLGDGGCANTASLVDDRGFRQVTNTQRTTRQGARLHLQA